MAGVARPGKARYGTAQISRQDDRTITKGDDMMKSEIVKAAVLVEDFDLYPRADVDSTHVAHIADAIEAGVEMPPVIACRKTKRIVDGFHRRRAHIRVFGDDADIRVVWNEYASEAELFEEAMRLNAAHGRNITSSDRTKCAIMANKLGISSDRIADALHVTVEKIESLLQYKVRVEGSRTPAILKYPVRHLAKREEPVVLTKSQAEVMPRLGGNNQTFYVNQLIMLIENDMLDRSNEKLMERLEILKGLIGRL
jgi:hypothetical protein